MNCLQKQPAYQRSQIIRQLFHVRDNYALAPVDVSQRIPLGLMYFTAGKEYANHLDTLAPYLLHGLICIVNPSLMVIGGRRLSVGEYEENALLRLNCNE